MFKMIKQHLGKYISQTIFAFIFSILLAITSVALPYVTGKYIDVLVNLKDRSKIYSFTQILILIIIFNIIFSYIKNLIIAKLKLKITFSLLNDVFSHLKKLPLFYFNTKESGYLSDRINMDCNELSVFIINTLIDSSINIISLFLYIYFIVKVNFKMMLFLLLFLPIYIFLYYVFRNPIYKSSYSFKESKSIFFSKLNEQIYAIKLIKINNLFNLTRIHLEKAFSEVFKCSIRNLKITYIFSSFDSLIGCAFTVVLFFYGGFEILEGRLTIGNFTIINKYFSMILVCVSYFLSLGQNYQTTLVSYTRLKNILECEIEENGSEDIDKIHFIKIDGITFKYNNKMIFKNFSEKFEANNIYCIIGENGTGKSTILNLITGLYKNYDGQILYNSTEISNLNLYNIRSNLFGIVEQPVEFIKDSIRNNITCANENILDTDILDYCKKMNLYDFIEKLPNGLNTTIDEKSINISGGEKQKIALLRAFIKQPNVLILDEPTTGLDEASIECFKNYLLKIKKDKITIIITHDNRILDLANRIINFDDKVMQD